MSASSPMKLLVRVGHKPHTIDRKKYGAPRLALYWASPQARFSFPGLHLWTGKRHLRLLPLRRRVL